MFPSYLVSKGKVFESVNYFDDVMSCQPNPQVEFHSSYSISVDLAHQANYELPESLDQDNDVPTNFSITEKLVCLYLLKVYLQSYLI